MDWVPSWNYSADNNTHTMVAEFKSIPIGNGYPIISLSDTIGWNVQINAGVMSGDVDIDLPAVLYGATQKGSEEIRILIAQEAGNSYNLTLAAADGDEIQLTDGTRGTSVQIIPTAGKITELSLCNVSSRLIGVLTAEW